MTVQALSSPPIFPSYRRICLGQDRNYGDAIVHVALTPVPIVPDQAPFALAANIPQAPVLALAATPSAESSTQTPMHVLSASPATLRGLNRLIPGFEQAPSDHKIACLCRHLDMIARLDEKYGLAPARMHLWNFHPDQPRDVKGRWTNGAYNGMISSSGEKTSDSSKGPMPSSTTVSDVPASKQADSTIPIADFKRLVTQMDDDDFNKRDAVSLEFVRIAYNKTPGEVNQQAVDQIKKYLHDNDGALSQEQKTRLSEAIRIIQAAPVEIEAGQSGCAKIKFSDPSPDATLTSVQVSSSDKSIVTPDLTLNPLPLNKADENDGVFIPLQAHNPGIAQVKFTHKVDYLETTTGSHMVVVTKEGSVEASFSDLREAAARNVDNPD